MIDTEDLEKIKQYNVQWHVKAAKNTGTYYARATKYLGMSNGKGTYAGYWLHIEITGANFKKGEYVNHINHDTLDNRKSNLEITSNSQNTKHRKGKNKNNKSGYRNVCWITDDEKWVVQLQVNGKNTRLGAFDDVDEAGKFAEKMRKEIYGKFAGGN